ncbi:MAG: porin family protein [Dysgonamonadaceae bacterium]|jgi:hypothetical protein|nr:porin family protein [Dysgonamonadaceae bacterium]
MKKYLLVLVMALISASVINAQESYKPGAGSFSLEVGFSPFAANGSAISLPSGSLTGIYSLNDAIAIRLGLGFSQTSASTDDKTNKIKGSYSETEFSITPGIVYSFAGTAKLTPYAGAEFLIGSTGSFGERESNYGSNNSSKTTRTNMDLNGDRFGINTFGIGVFTGFNYYFAKNLYIGAEVGLGYTSVSLKDGEITQGTTATKYENESTASAIGFHATPTLRLGWAF